MGRLLQGAFQVIDVQVREYRPSGVREPNTVDQTCVIRGVGKDDIVWLEYRTEQSDIRGIPRREVESGFGADKPGKCGFKLFPTFMISRQQP